MNSSEKTSQILRQASGILGGNADDFIESCVVDNVIHALRTGAPNRDAPPSPHASAESGPTESSPSLQSLATAGAHKYAYLFRPLPWVGASLLTVIVTVTFLRTTQWQKASSAPGARAVNVR